MGSCEYYNIVDFVSNSNNSFAAFSDFKFLDCLVSVLLNIMIQVIFLLRIGEGSGVLVLEVGREIYCFFFPSNSYSSTLFII